MTIKLFVGNLPYSITEEQIKEAFSQKERDVRSVRVALDRETQRPRGFAFVEMGSDKDADGAIADLHNQMLAGRTIFVEKAQERGAAPREGGQRRPPSGPPGAGNSRPFTPRPHSDQPRRPDFSPRPPRAGGYAPPAAHFEEPTPGRRHKTKPEKKTTKEKRNTGRPEERERGKWRWDGNNDY